MTVSPTQRALQECRRLGWTAQVVEHWVPRAHIRRDLFGCIDIVALTSDGILGVQVTSGSNHAARRRKILASPSMRKWAKWAAVEVWSYSKRSTAGKRKVWTLRREVVCP